MTSERPRKVLVIGGGPAGLMAAEVLSAAGVVVELFDAMPSVGRKFLLAGKGGLNLTHSEPIDRFESRFEARQAVLAPMLQAFGPTVLRDWASGLGVSTFVGSSGRVFPTDMKAAPLLRAWLQRLRHPASGVGVRFHMRHRWTGVLTRSADIGFTLAFDTVSGPIEVTGDAVVLALGGASWARLGSDGAWVPHLQARAVAVAPLLPSNCGFDRAGGWSTYFSGRFAGQPFKSVAIELASVSGNAFRRKGEFVVTASGLEGSLVYAASSLLRERIRQHGQTVLQLDLLPDLSPERVAVEVSHPRGSRSLSSHLKSRLGLDGIKMAVLHECLSKAQLHDPTALAKAIKALPIELAATRPIDEAISSAGGVRFDGLTDELMVRHLPGVFCAGEMLDWEAPTGGYLLTACFATGRQAGQGALNWLPGH